MTGTDTTNESQANILCKACGLCCTGHLFAWTKLRSAELDSAEALGLKVLRSIPSQRGFNQPCPLWQGQCTIYASPQYPHFCRTYKCKLLKKVLDETTSLSEALKVVEGTKDMIRELDSLLPYSRESTFRERLVAHLETLDRRRASRGQKNGELDFRPKAYSLLDVYRTIFGITDLGDFKEL